MQRLIDLARRLGEHVPLSALGLIVAGSAYLAYLWSRVPSAEAPSGRSDYVVQLVSALALALVGVALLVVVAGALLTHLAFKKNLERNPRLGMQVLTFEAKRGFLSFLRMPAWRFFPLIEIRWDWERPEGFSVTQERIDDALVEHVETATRTSTSEIVRRFVIEDGFGLAKIVLRRKEAQNIRVLPWTGELESSPMLRSLTGGDDLPHPYGKLTGDRVDMRQYVPGDPLRLALWKLYARTGQLMVRTPERAIAPSVRIVAYLPSARGDEPAAAAARVAVQAGLLGEGWIFSADGANHPASDIDGALSLISASRKARETDRGDAAGLGLFLETVTQNDPVRIILFVPAVPGPWLDRAVAASKKYGAAVSVLIVTDGVREPEGQATLDRKLERMLKVPEADVAGDDGFTTPEAVGEVARAFAPFAQVMALERVSGRALALGIRGQAPAITSRRVA